MAIQDITSPIIFGSGYVKRLSSSLGFGTSPTIVELEIVDDPDGQLGTQLNFASTQLVPGNISGIHIGNFHFNGVVQSWQKQYSVNGITHNVKLSDPRIIFPDVYLIANGRGPSLPSQANIAVGTGIYNVINVWDYYGNDPAAQYNEHGMPWNKIKHALESTGLVTVYNKQFRLVFSTGFTSPDYYRINGDDFSLDACLNTVANALGIDYFVEIDPTGYIHNTGLNNIYIRSVQRQITATGSNIFDYITEKQSDGTLISYTLGQELRNGPTDVILLGANKRFIQTFTDTFPSYGRTAEGRILTGAGNSVSLGASFKALDDPDRHSGYVILENIVTSNPSLLSNLPTISPEGKTRYLTSTSYPPGATVDELTNAIVGYRPTENVMRAALFSQASWEAILFKEQQEIAKKLQISGIAIRLPEDSTQWISTNFVNPFTSAPKMRSERLGGVHRTREQEAIIRLFYESTKSVADTYYGKEWLINLPVNYDAFVEDSADGAGLKFRYGYRIADAGWYENAPSELKHAGNVNFRTENGLHKAHILLNDARLNQSAGAVIKNPDGNNFDSYSYNLQIDLSHVSKEKYLESGNDIYLACDVEQDATNLARAIVRIDNPIEFALAIEVNPSVGSFKDAIGSDINYTVSATGIPSSYLEFWLAMGASNAIQLNNLSQIYDNNRDLGLAPQRLTYIDLVQVPIENELSVYGPFYATGIYHGGTNVIRDDSLAPWTYGGYSSMNTAGQALANMSLMNRTVIDVASFSVAGLPEYGLGDLLGENANISSISMSLGTDGLVTSYSLQTFISPLTRMAKVLHYKTDELKILTNKIKKDIINLDKMIEDITSSNSNYTIGENENATLGSMADTPIKDVGTKKSKRDSSIFTGKYNFNTTA